MMRIRTRLMTTLAAALVLALSAVFALDASMAQAAQDNPDTTEVQAASREGAARVSLGANHSAAIKSDGSLWTWGRNNVGQLGDGGNMDTSVPIQIMEGTEFIQVSLGYDHSAALSSDGLLWTWGSNQYCQLGDGTTTNRSTPVQVLSDVTQVAMGWYHSAAIRSDGSLWMWGNNASGQLGDGTTTNRSTPVKVMDDVVQISLGQHHSAAITSDGSLWVWGYNGYGQLGDGTYENHLTPMKVLDGVEDGAVVQVALGDMHSAAIKADGTLWMWGYNGYGQLGNGTTTESLVPMQVTALGNGVTQVAMGRAYSAAIKSDGSLWTWGYNASGQLGDGTTTSKTTPVEVTELGVEVSQVALGVEHSAAIKADGSLWMWGWNKYGQLGDGIAKLYPAPKKVEGMGGKVSQVSFSYSHAAVIKGGSASGTGGAGTSNGSVGTLWTWGFNDYGQLGDGTDMAHSTPSQVMAGKEFIQVALGEYHSAAIASDGSLWTWGLNDDGQLGDGTATNRSIPVKVGEGARFVQVALGKRHSAAIASDGSLWTWGLNDDGQLGDGTETGSLVPKKVMDDVAQVALGEYHSAAIKTDGSLWTWGYNYNGQLGDGTYDSSSTPVQIKSGTRFVQVALGSSHSAAIDSSGNLWMWGSNFNGKLGDGTTTERLSPVKVMDGVVQVSLGDNHSAALASDGSLWTWGYNYYGMLGDGTATNRSTPVQVMEGVVQVALGQYHSAAITSDGSLWMWGKNDFIIPGKNPVSAYYWPVEFMDLDADIPGPDPTDPPGPGPTDSPEPPGPTGPAKELAGSNRYETAALIAREAYPDGALGAIVATGKDFPDALGAASLAGMLDYPILLTEQGNLPQATHDALASLDVNEVIVVGGPGAVSDKVFRQLQDLLGEDMVERVAGNDRYKTAEAVYDAGCARGMWGTTAIIATGKNYPDALSISGYAFAQKAPIFLCDPNKGLSEETKDALLWGGFSQVIVVGGAGVVKPEVAKWVEENLGIVPERLAGDDRYQTSRAIGGFVLANGGTADGACIATGSNFPDALAGGVLVGRIGTILLLADPGAPKLVALDALSTSGDDVDHIYFLGGTGAVPQSTRDAAKAAAGLD